MCMPSAFYAWLIKTCTNQVIKNDKISIQFTAHKQELIAMAGYSKCLSPALISSSNLGIVKA